MSRRGNCHDNAVAESFFQQLKRERFKKRIYGTRDEPRSDILLISKCFITVSVGMVRASRCHRPNMKTYIINGSEVSRLSVAIQFRVSVWKS
ncbi:integrase catalytic subunit [Klebsiella variicola]|nr:integrase catalytic subunit [Klebsiella variicola]